MTSCAAAHLHRCILIAAAGILLGCTPDPVVEDALSKQPPPAPTKRTIKIPPRDPRLPPPAQDKAGTTAATPPSTAPVATPATDVTGPAAR
ncbi:MAG: hypothetical protein IPH07_27460 [Deltaproteobacteria bacterium]|nr:hypothetical protein [Deltaproteobacteria bacterium]MBK8714631.1 hypothetical protein [Deltaproteobacteria bacterium]MBP7292230.1 hypothetical protein [Nannocystaceae bacterium]